MEHLIASTEEKRVFVVYDSITFELKCVREIYTGKARADIGRAYAEACGYRFEYVPYRGNLPAKCSVFRPPTKEEVDDHERDYEYYIERGKVLKRLYLSEEDWKWLGREVIFCYVGEVQLLQIRMPDSSEEIAFVKNLLSYDVTGWLAYADWLGERDHDWAAKMVRSAANLVVLEDGPYGYRDWSLDEVRKRIEGVKDG